MPSETHIDNNCCHRVSHNIFYESKQIKPAGIFRYSPPFLTVICVTQHHSKKSE